jgi:hypothetical protein
MGTAERKAVFLFPRCVERNKRTGKDTEMPEEEKAENVDNQDEAKQDHVDASAETKKTETEHMIPKARLDDEIQKRKDLEKRLAAMEKTHNEAETKRLKESEDYKALYERTAAELADAKPKAEKLEVFETTLRETLTAAIEEIPAERRGLIPEELSVEAQLRWISRNRALLAKSTPFDIGAGKKGGDGKSAVQLTPEQLEAARKTGATPEEYAKYLKH